ADHAVVVADVVATDVAEDQRGVGLGGHGRHAVLAPRVGERTTARTRDVEGSGATLAHVLVRGGGGRARTAEVEQSAQARGVAAAVFDDAVVGTGVGADRGTDRVGAAVRTRDVHAVLAPLVANRSDERRRRHREARRVARANRDRIRIIRDV